MSHSGKSRTKTDMVPPTLPEPPLVSREAMLLAIAIFTLGALWESLLFPSMWAVAVPASASGVPIAILLAAALSLCRRSLGKLWWTGAATAVVLSVLLHTVIGLLWTSHAGRTDVGVDGYALPQTAEEMRMLFFVGLNANFWIFGSYALALGLLMAQRSALETKAQLARAELDVLRLQLAPHFLMNAFNSLLSLVEMGRKSEAGEMIISISSFFRAVLTSDMSRPITLGEEIDNLHDYLAIERSWLGDRLEFDIDIPDSVERAGIPPQILQPLLENIIHHVVARSKEVVRARLTATATAGTLELLLINSLPPDWTPVHRGTGLGQRNVADRLRHLYGRQATLDVQRSSSEFHARISLPLRELNNEPAR